MTVTDVSVETTFPEEWDPGDVEGRPFSYDPMHAPNPISPLQASVDLPALSYGWTEGFRSFGIPVRGFEILVRNYYQYSRSLMKPPSKGLTAPEEPDPVQVNLERAIRELPENWYATFLPEIQRQVAQLTSIDLEHASFAELPALLDQIDEIARALWKLHFHVVQPMLLAVQLFDELYVDLFEGTAADARELVTGTVSESINAGFGLSDLAARARELHLESIFESTPPECLAETLGASPAGKQFLADLDRYLEDFGYRQDLYEMTSSTWIEEPAIPLAYVQSYLQSGYDARVEQANISRMAAAKLDEARATLATYPQLVRDQFEDMLQSARFGAFLQEEHNFHIDQRYAARLRLAYLGLGRRLVTHGLLEAPDDILMLEADEVRELAEVAGLADQRDRIRALVQRRRKEMAIAATLTPPPMIGTPDGDMPTPDNPMLRAMHNFFGGPPQQAVQPDQLKGNPGSRGTATGVARVARTLAEARSLQLGEVLVAVTTMPPWTPLFAVAAAIVTETGGALSHCAIVAREYGVPAVVGVHGATNAIHTGQIITVDGETGVVTLHPDD